MKGQRIDPFAFETPRDFNRRGGIVLPADPVFDKQRDVDGIPDGGNDGKRFRR